MITNPKFVCAFVHDQDRALRFWTETVGWRLQLDAPMDPESGERWIEVAPPRGTTYLVLSRASGPDDPRVEASSVWWDVDDLDATHAELTARGVEFPVPPSDAPWKPGTRWAQLRDSEGCHHGLSEPDGA